MADERVPAPDEPVRGEGEGVPGTAGEAAAAEPAGETLAELREARDALAREAAEARERHLRTLADFDNYRKRVAREREDWTRQAQERLLLEILPVLDNFDRALRAPVPPGDDSSFRQGVELIHRDFLAALERLGVRPFPTVGEAFDPFRHEAVGRVERTDVDDQTVVDETLRGYLFHDRVLRPARVVVAVHPAPAAAGGEGAA